MSRPPRTLEGAKTSKIRLCPRAVRWLHRSGRAGDAAGPPTRGSGPALPVDVSSFRRGGCAAMATAACRSAFRRPRSRPGGAGLELLGDRQRAPASAARSRGFHPPPTSAWRREEVGGRLGGHVVAQGPGAPSLIRGYPARCLCEVQSPLDPRALWPVPREETLRHCFSSLLPPLSSLDLEVP